MMCKRKQNTAEPETGFPTTGGGPGDAAFACLTRTDRVIKRSFDFIVALLGCGLCWWLILLTWLVATLDTGKNGWFTQVRVGRYGRRFKTIKIRTMRDLPHIETTVTSENDPRITAMGRVLRKTKLDELPQLINVLLGQMSFVGPRPDVPGFADLLEGADRIILSVRPGITGPATLKYRHEEKLLAGQEDPEAYNRDVIFPDKIRLNRQYVEQYSFRTDMMYLIETIFRSDEA